MFPFSTRNFMMTTTKITLQATVVINFHRNFPLTYFKSLFTKNLFPPNFFVKCCSVLRDFYTFLLFLSKRSRKVPVRHDLLYDTAIKSIQNIYSIFSFPGTPYRRVPSQKRP